MASLLGDFEGQKYDSIPDPLPVTTGSPNFQSVSKDLSDSVLTVDVDDTGHSSGCSNYCSPRRLAGAAIVFVMFSDALLTGAMIPAAPTLLGSTGSTTCFTPPPLPISHSTPHPTPHPTGHPSPPPPTDGHEDINKDRDDDKGDQGTAGQGHSRRLLSSSGPSEYFSLALIFVMKPLLEILLRVPSGLIVASYGAMAPMAGGTLLMGLAAWVWCEASLHTVGGLILARILQGCGAAMLGCAIPALLNDEDVTLDDGNRDQMSEEWGCIEHEHARGSTVQRAATATGLIFGCGFGGAMMCSEYPTSDGDVFLVACSGALLSLLLQGSILFFYPKIEGCLTAPVVNLLQGDKRAPLLAVLSGREGACPALALFATAGIPAFLISNLALSLEYSDSVRPGAVGGIMCCLLLGEATWDVVVVARLKEQAPQGFGSGRGRWWGALAAALALGVLLLLLGFVDSAVIAVLSLLLVGGLCAALLSTMFASFLHACRDDSQGVTSPTAAAAGQLIVVLGAIVSSLLAGGLSSLLEFGAGCLLLAFGIWMAYLPMLLLAVGKAPEVELTPVEAGEAMELSPKESGTPAQCAPKGPQTERAPQPESQALQRQRQGDEEGERPSHRPASRPLSAQALARPAAAMEAPKLTEHILERIDRECDPRGQARAQGQGHRSFGPTYWEPGSEWSPQSSRAVSPAGTPPDSPSGGGKSGRQKRIYATNMVMLKAKSSRRVRGTLIFSHTRHLTLQEDLLAWTREDLRQVEEGTLFEDEIVFQVRDGPIQGLSRHTTLYTWDGPHGSRDKRNWVEIPDFPKIKNDMEAVYPVREEPYTFNFEPYTTPTGKHYVPGLYFMKVQFKDARGRTFLMRKVRFQLVQQESTSSDTSNYDTEDDGRDKIPSAEL